MLHTAATLIALLALVHSVLGERAIIIRLLRRDDLPKLFGSDTFTKQTLRYIWHLVTVLALGMAWLLVQIADGAPPTAVVRTLAGTLFASAALAVVVTRGRHLSWVIMVMAGIICMRYVGMYSL